MNRTWTAVLVALAAGGCGTIPTDPRAASIPGELAVAKLKELLPKSTYVSVAEPGIRINQSDLRDWKVDSTGFEFKSTVKQQFRLAWSDCRGAELVKLAFSLELRIFADAPRSRKKEILQLHWKDETDARQAAELFEALRGDR